VVSIRRDLASSSLLLDQRNAPLVECLHERQRGEVYRDHSRPSLGAGSRWAVAGGLDTHRRARWRSPSLLLDQRNAPLVECLHERQRGEVYRDHSKPSLGVGSR
jgi:hypothetical protein